MDEQNNIEELPPQPPSEVAGVCGMCMRPKKDPVTANCGHGFCWECINDYVLSIPPDAILSCPVCFLDIEAYSMILS